MLGDFYSQGVAQLGLFDEYKPRCNSEQLMAVLDGINHSGTGRGWFAGQGIEKRSEMKREMLSLPDTTRFADLMKVIRGEKIKCTLKAQYKIELRRLG